MSHTLDSGKAVKLLTNNYAPAVPQGSVGFIDGIYGDEHYVVAHMRRIGPMRADEIKLVTNELYDGEVIGIVRNHVIQWNADAGDTYTSSEGLAEYGPDNLTAVERVRVGLLHYNAKGEIVR
jgi:hypothetical protein